MTSTIDVIPNGFIKGKKVSTRTILCCPPKRSTFQKLSAKLSGNLLVPQPIIEENIPKTELEESHFYMEIPGKSTSEIMNELVKKKAEQKEITLALKAQLKSLKLKQKIIKASYDAFIEQQGQRRKLTHTQGDDKDLLNASHPGSVPQKRLSSGSSFDIINFNDKYNALLEPDEEQIQFHRDEMIDAIEPKENNFLSN